MKNYTLTDRNGKQYRRITRAMAKKLYNNGISVIICPSNLRPFTMWGHEMKININDHDNENAGNFDKRLMYFEYYNCNCNETGRYTNFYALTKGGAK